MKENILHILWLLGKSLKALLFLDFALASEGFSLMLLHLFHKNEKIEDKEEDL